MQRVAFLAARRVCIDAYPIRSVWIATFLDETSISGAERVPFPLSFLPPSPSYNHRVRPSRSRWNNRREGSEEPGDYELGMTQPPAHIGNSPLRFRSIRQAWANPGRRDEVLRHTALSFSSFSGRPLESAEHHPSLRVSSVPTGDTLRRSEVVDVGGINQEDVLAKQGEEHVRVSPRN